MGNGTYLPIFVLLLGAIGFAVTPLALAWLWAKKFSPQKPGHDKNSIYECGLETKDDAWATRSSSWYSISKRCSCFPSRLFFQD
jgi:NADH:ubiquinone oxidoreductase subunit 3 (subunit A)